MVESYHETAKCITLTTKSNFLFLHFLNLLLPQEPRVLKLAEGKLYKVSGAIIVPPECQEDLFISSLN